MKKNIILIVTVFFFFAAATAQNPPSGRLDSLRSKLKTPLEDTAKINLLLQVGDIYKNTIPDTSLYYYNMALLAASKANSKKYIAASYNNIGIVQLNKGAYDKAIEYYLKALKFYEDVGDKKGMAYSYNSIGNVHLDQGAYDKAIKCYLKALKITEELGDRKGMSACYHNIGDLQVDQGAYDKATEYYLKALKITEELRDKKGMALCYNGIGNVPFIQGAYNKAIEYYSKALKITEEIGDKEGMALSYNNIGSVHYAQGTYNKAIEYYLKSLKIREELGDKNGISVILSNIAGINIELKKYNKAIEYAQKGLNLAKETGVLLKQSYNYETLSIAYDSLHNYKKAYEYHVLFKQINDSIFNEESSKQIKEMQTKYETEKKESQIKILQKDKELQASQLSREKWIRNLSLAGMGLMFLLIIGAFFYIRVWRVKEKIATEKKIIELEQKSLLLQMNPHFIFNSLNSISAQMLQNLNVAREYLAKFARLMRLILENSREAFVPMKNETDTINYYLALEQQRLINFDYKVIIDDDITSDNVEIPPMLIQPHVENAIIHGIAKKQERGYIEVRLSKSAENLIQCVVEDNGVGRKKSGEDKGNLAVTHKSLALEITQERLKMLSHGNKEALSVIIDDIEDDKHDPLGTKVTITMPYRLL